MPVWVPQQLAMCWAQGKVRRMRESPFNKASGLAKQQPAKTRMAPALLSPVKAESDNEVSHSVLQVCRPNTLVPQQATASGVYQQLLSRTMLVTKRGAMRAT